MDTKKVISLLNEALALEYAAVIQYLQHSSLVTGLEREVYEGFFQSGSNESRNHAKEVAEKIVALGGLPTVEPAPTGSQPTLQKCWSRTWSWNIRA